MATPRRDEDCVTSLRNGDRGAFEAFFERYHGPISAYCGRFGNTSEAQAMTELAFRTLLEALPTYDQNEPMDEWVFALVRHTIVRVAQRQGTDEQDQLAVR